MQGKIKRESRQSTLWGGYREIKGREAGKLRGMVAQGMKGEVG